MSFGRYRQDGSSNRSYEKYFHELLQILVNWHENLRINTDKVLSYAAGKTWMGTSNKLDEEFGIDLLDS